ncbi:MAG: hypothetical protein RL095_2586 [Verrucomicrobiota bacterium]|jgi:preprotein translocase subunit SecA
MSAALLPHAGIRRTEALPKGLDAAYSWLKGHCLGLAPRQGRLMRRARKLVARWEAELMALDDASLRQRLTDMRQVFRLGRETPAQVDEAFALIREAGGRTLGMRHYPVQVAAGLALESGLISELATGEGKTLTACLAAILAGWRGRGCHVMTSNNYLATRDCEDMRPLYEFCQVSVAALADDSKDEDRRRAYQCDVTYCTNKDAAADFLRDTLAAKGLDSSTAALLASLSGAPSPHLPMQRGLACAIVDEADSVMIDDGGTPLLISGESNSKEELAAFSQAYEIARGIEAGRDYDIDEKLRRIDLTEAGRRRMDALCAEAGLKGLWDSSVRREEFIVQALVARHFFIRDKQFIIDDGKVVIVDESTGRLMPDRFWRAGLHQAVEAKEGVKVNPPKETFARISFQRFFRLYHRLSGMTGTAAEAKSEFYRFYQLTFVRIPTNRPCLRRDFGQEFYLHRDDKLQAILESAARIHAEGRPVLIGTGSILESEAISQLLNERGLEHTVLNARYYAEEAAIVARAGQGAAITVATNMAGRGTDIKLDAAAKAAGGLHVICSERFTTARVDRQLQGRASRQGDPGSAESIICLDDPIFTAQTPRLAKILQFCLRPLGRRIRIPGASLLPFLAQAISTRFGELQREAVLKSDEWLNKSLGFTGKDQL